MTQPLTKSGTPRKRAPGGGRKPSAPVGTMRRWFYLYPETNALIARWQREHGDCSASKAVRDMIEKASEG